MLFVDYGWWKNWKSPWGDIAIEQRPPCCNRGRVIIKTLTEGAVNNLFNPLLGAAYFFDEGRAMHHLHMVTELAQALTDEELRALNAKPIGSQTFEGKDCTCVLDTSALATSAIERNLFTFWVEVPPREKAILVVDWADGFPRHYLDKAIARAEIEAWMRCRGQIEVTKK